MVAPRDSAYAGIVGAAVAAFYAIGAGRAFNLDAAATVANFVATPSLLDSFTEQLVYNNHVLFSFADHLVYSATGSSDEALLRALPIIAAGLALAVLSTELARRFGWPAAVGAAGLVAVNPLMVENAREVRGYSMLVLATIVSTALLARLRADEPHRGADPGYVLALAAGIATHLYGLLVVLLHIAAVGVDRRSLRAWAPRWTAAVVLGLAPLALVLPDMLASDDGGRWEFRPDFPVDVFRELSGGGVAIGAVSAALVALGWWVLRGSRSLTRVGLAAAALVLAASLLSTAEPRFFIWLVPAAGYLAAAAISRWPWLLAALVVVVVGQGWRLAPDMARSELANRDAAAVIEAATRAGATACAFGLSAHALSAYTRRAREIESPGHVQGCDLVVQVFGPPRAEGGPPGAPAPFPHSRILPARLDGVIWSRAPLSCWLRGEAARSRRARASQLC